MFVSASFYRSERGFVLKRFDSFIIYKALCASSGLSGVLTYSEVTLALNGAGLKTRRGAKFTERVVRQAIGEIAEAGLIELEPAQGGGFRLRLVADPYKGQTLFDDGRLTITETVTEKEEFGVEVPSPVALEDDDKEDDSGDSGASCRSISGTVTETVLVGGGCININTQEKEINKSAREEGARPKRKNPKYGNTQKPACEFDVDQAVASVDVDDAEGRELRRKLVEIVWEPSLRSDLLDRAVAAVKLGLARSCEVLSWARRALNASRDGSKRIWQTFTLDVKRAFDETFVWVPTRPGQEPAPSFAAPRVVKRVENDDEGDGVFRAANGMVFVRAAF